MSIYIESHLQKAGESCSQAFKGTSYGYLVTVQQYVDRQTDISQ